MESVNGVEVIYNEYADTTAAPKRVPIAGREFIVFRDRDHLLSWLRQTSNVVRVLPDKQQRIFPD